MSTHEKLINYKIVNMRKKSFKDAQIRDHPNRLYEFICQIIESPKKKIK